MPCAIYVVYSSVEDRDQIMHKMHRKDKFGSHLTVLPFSSKNRDKSKSDGKFRTEAIKKNVRYNGLFDFAHF